jgi:AcrR family transcriptional regulator
MVQESSPVADGLRTLHKRRSHERIAEVAAELFDSAPYDAVTIEQIAASAEVSARTVFRYFATKEDLALSQLADLDGRFLAYFDRRSAAEPLLESLRAAMHLTWREQGRSGSTPQHRYLRLLRTVETEPGLFAANLRRAAAQEDRLVARAILRFQGPTAELSASLAVAAFGAAVRVAEDRWRKAGQGDLSDLHNQIDTCVDQLLPVLIRAAAPNAE